MNDIHLTTAPETSPITPDKTLGRITSTAYTVAALGRIVKDLAVDPFADEEDKSEYLDRLCALGECIDMLARQIANQADEFNMPRATAFKSAG